MQNRAATDRERPEVSNEEARPDSSPSIAFLLTFTTYGSWLHGDERGSVDRNTNGFDSPRLVPNPGRLRFVREVQMNGPAFVLDPHQRHIVGNAIRDLCTRRGWLLRAVNVRSNHVHLVVTANDRPDRVAGACKAIATRRLREARLVSSDQKLWTRHGSTRYLWTDADVERASIYVTYGQDLADHEPAAATSNGTLPIGRGSDSVPTIVNRQSPGSLP